MAKDYKIFISHSWAHSTDLQGLQKLLSSRGYFTVEFTEASKDVPINSTNATYIKARLKAKIQSIRKSRFITINKTCIRKLIKQIESNSL